MANLWCNQLSALPESFGQLAALPTLDLQGNRLGALPESFGTGSRGENSGDHRPTRARAKADCDPRAWRGIPARGHSRSALSFVGPHTCSRGGATALQIPQRRLLSGASSPEGDGAPSVSVAPQGGAVRRWRRLSLEIGYRFWPLMPARIIASQPGRCSLLWSRL